jgi:hypothetical protein
MCWKKEWAAAYNNLSNAIIHVERGRAKLVKRAEKRKATIEKLLNKPDTKHPELLATAEGLYAKMNTGVALCTDVITDLKQRQEELKHLINDYGERRTDNAKMVQQVMEGKRKVRMVGKPEEWHSQR